MSRSITALAALILFLSIAPARAADIPVAILNPYLEIQTALAADALENAQKAAVQFTVQASLAGISQKAIMASNKLSAAYDLKTARSAFGELSDIMIAWAGDGTGGKDVSVAYCPMVKKSWLQKGKEIANPYYGSAMLRCGSFTKVPK